MTRAGARARKASAAATGAGTRAELFLGTRDGGPVTFSGEGSLLTVGPPGTGKSRGVAVWNLLQYPGSMLVTDPKGELAGWSAEARRKLGQEVVVLDPFGVTEFPSASINPLDGLIEAVRRGERFRSEAERLAFQLLPDLASSKDPYWRAGGRRLIVSALLYLAILKPDECHLPGLHRVLWFGDEALAGVLDEMRGADGLGADALHQYAGDTESAMADQPKAFASFRQEAREALSIFAADEPCGRACMVSNVDLARLIPEKLTVFLILPSEFVASHGRWMGLVTAHAIHSIMKAKGRGDCVFLLDEFPNLGPLPGIRDAVALLRGKGLRVWMFVQDIGQLEALYGRADADNLRSQAEVLQVLGCRSLELARFIEARGGQRTARTLSVGLPDPRDLEGGPKANLGETGLPVFPVASVMQMPLGKQLLIRHGYPVIVADVMLWTDG